MTKGSGEQGKWRPREVVLGKGSGDWEVGCMIVVTFCICA